MTVGGDLIAEGDLDLVGNFNTTAENLMVGGNLTISSYSSAGMSISADGEVMVAGNLNAFGDLNLAAASQMEIMGNVNAENSNLDLTADRLRFGSNMVKVASLKLNALGGGDELRALPE